MKNLITLLTATLLVASAPLVQAQDKSPTPTPVVTTAPAIPATLVAADAPKTRAQVRAELEEARRRGELEPGYRWGVDLRGQQR